VARKRDGVGFGVVAQDFDGEAAAVRSNSISLVRLLVGHFAARGFLVVDFERFCSALPSRLALSG
jgi:hypothetical protein